MLGLFLFYLTCYGLTTIIVQSKIFKPVREYFKDRVPFIYSLLNCMMCTSFWVGIFVVISLGFSPVLMYLVADVCRVGLFAIFFDAFSVVGMTWLIHTIQIYFESKSGVEL